MTTALWPCDALYTPPVRETPRTNPPPENLQVEAPTLLAMQGKLLAGSLPHIATRSSSRNLLHLQLRALERRSLSHQLEAEGQGRGNDLAQVADLQVHLRDPPPVRVAAGDLDDGVGYGQLMQALTLPSHQRLNEPPQHVVYGSLHLLDARNVIRTHDHRVVRQPFAHDPPPVVPDDPTGSRPRLRSSA